MRCLAALVILIQSLSAKEPLDQIALIVRDEVITELQVEEEIGITAFLNETSVDRSPLQRRAAAGRILDQTLIKQDMQLAAYPAPDEADTDRALEGVRGVQGTAQFEAKLKRYRLTVAQLRAHLELQIAELRFTAFRFRPAAAVSDTDIDERYAKDFAGVAPRGMAAPTAAMAQGRELSRRSLVEERTDAALTTWLTEQHKQVRIVYLDADLQPASDAKARGETAP